MLLIPSRASFQVPGMGPAVARRGCVYLLPHPFPLPLADKKRRCDEPTHHICLFIYIRPSPPTHINKQPNRDWTVLILIICHLSDCLLDREENREYLETCTVSPLAHSHDSPPYLSSRSPHIAPFSLQWTALGRFRAPTSLLPAPPPPSLPPPSP